MGNAIIARLASGHRSPRVVESPHPQRQDRLQDRIEEGLPNSGAGGGGSAIDTREAPMPQYQPWSDFTAAKLLPDSVYLWACDEPHPGGTRPSRSDAWVAWITIIMQMLCYLQLIVVSSSDDPSTSSSVDEVTLTANVGSYTFFSVAAAMYLMTSIAAADLGASIALISEARMGMAAKRWVQRKIFGLMLLVSFILLSAASVMVLFKTSSEDVELVVGAATVLFIADVDEKVMVVLKAIPSKWRLFWVLELIGLSGGLASLGLRTTGNASTVSKSDDYYAEYSFIYSWYFMLCIYPVFVTIISILVNAFVARPKEFVTKHVLGNGSPQDWLFALVLALWIVIPFLPLFLDNFYSIWVSILMFFIFFVQITGGAYWLFLVCKRLVCCRGSDQYNAGYANLRWTLSTKFGMVYVPVSLFSVRTVMRLVSDEDWVVILDAFHLALFHMWLVWCMCRESSGCPESPEMPSSPEPANIVVNEPVTIAGSQRLGSVTESYEEGGSRRSTRNLVLGWIQANALLMIFLLLFLPTLFFGNRWLFLLPNAMYVFAWSLVGVCAAASSTKGVAFWSLATYMLYIGFFSIWTWRYGGNELNLVNLPFFS